MNVLDIVAVVSGIAAVFSALYAHHAWTIARQAILHQAIMDIHADYRSVEMMDAIESLWDFYRLFGKDRIVDEYEKTRAADKVALGELPPKERADFLANTLHHKRRLVSQFYFHLAHLYVNNILHRDILYASWSRADLSIIPEILLPIEVKLGKAFGIGTPKQLMAKLWDDAPEHAPQSPGVPPE